MPFEGAVKEIYDKLQPEEQVEVYHYMCFLASFSKANETGKAVAPMKFDTLKGKIKVFDNFDDPLPELEGYM